MCEERFDGRFTGVAHLVIVLRKANSAPKRPLRECKEGDIQSWDN
jgi:hypothetical protein